MPQLDHRAHEHRRIVAGQHVADERLVDLDRIHRQLLQVAQAGVAGAEVVDEQLDAEPLEAHQRVQRPGRILHQRALGELELDPRRPRAPGGEQPLDPIEQLRVAQIVGGEIDRDRPVEAGFVPCMALAEHRLQHPMGERRDEARVFRQRDELAG